MASNVAQPTTLDIDGFTIPLFQPDSLADAQEIVKEAYQNGDAVYPVGGATNLGWGMPPIKPGAAVQLQRLAQVIDYPARDMTITVEAGISVGKLRQILAEENQRLPIDVARAETATLGGAMAVNASGLRRYGCGTLRDYVIGISVINDEGQKIKAGGRVVKNVAGYDLCKLFIGSFGTLGILSEVTLKVVPSPEQHALAVLQCSAVNLTGLLDRLHQTQTRPNCIEAVNSQAVQSINQRFALDIPLSDWVVAVGFESNADAVNWQIQQLIKELDGAYALDVHIGQAAEPVWDALAEFPGWPEAGMTLQANFLPGKIADFCAQSSEFAETTMLQVHAGNGIVIGHVSAESEAESAIAFIDHCRKHAAAVVVQRCPVAWKTGDLVWGKPAAVVSLMRAVKEKLDPKSLFNPGRYYGGI